MHQPPHAEILQPAPATPTSVLRVLTLNLHKGFSSFNRRLVLHELREAVRGVAADLVFLQETVGAHATHPARYPQWPAVSQHEFLADTIWPAQAYGRNAVYPDGHHGNALLSKFPISYYRNHPIERLDREPRGLLHSVIAVPGLAQPLHTVCLHLGLRARDRREELEQLAALIDAEVPAGAPLVVAGDFNDWTLRGHRQLQRLTALREVFGEARGRLAATYPARWPLLRLDRIYVRNLQRRHQAVLSMRPWSHLSDHAGLLAELSP